MAGLHPLPQTLHHTSTRLTHLEAHTLLSSFLHTAETNPAYRPDAVLTQHGPQAANIGSGSNLTLNQLRRILAGIEGKRVGGVEFNYGRGPAPKKKRKRGDEGEQGFTSSPPVPVMDGGEEVVEMADGAGTREHGQGEAALVARETDGWQDKEDYELAQVEEMEDVGDRDPADPGAGIEGRVDDMDAASVAGQGLTKAEKEARKLAKKERRKKEKRQMIDRTSTAKG